MTMPTIRAVASGFARYSLLLIIVGAVVLASMARGTANYAGVCLREMRVLDSREQNRRVYQYLKDRNVLTARGDGGEVVETVDNGFGYESYAAFASANPSCCTYSQIGPLNASIPLLIKASGNRRSFVRVEYLAVWGNARPTATRRTRHLVISNCGEVDDIYP